MVDNDRFMAIMNVDNGRKCHLHAMNETKLSIPLADSCENRYYDQSIYHEYYHKIITVGSKSTEWYDINKDKSMIIARYENKYMLSNIWYSPFEPNILYTTNVKYKETTSYMNRGNVFIMAIDYLRNGILETTAFLLRFCCLVLVSTKNTKFNLSSHFVSESSQLNAKYSLDML